QTPLYAMETTGPGVFCKMLQAALLRGEIDLAVHSLKDLPTVGPAGLEVVAVPQREEAGDCLLIHPDAYVASHPSGVPLKEAITVATSSLRRQAQMLSHRPDILISS